jgi:cytochrome c biogenesis protein CcdA/thiol-disulfide isomerase/thioredoxin
MALILAFAFAAGIVTILSPCILPVLPIVLSGSAGEGRRRPIGIITGFIASFTFFTLSLSSIVGALGIPPDALRILAACTVLVFGLVMAVPALKTVFSRFAAGFAARGTPKAGSRTFAGGFVLGLSLGLVWTPCVGPIMASVISLSLTGAVDSQSLFITLAYSAGTAIPLFFIMLGGRKLLNRFSTLARNTDRIQRVFGVLMVGTALALFTGADRGFQTWLLDIFPQYGAGLTALEQRPEVIEALDRLTAERPEQSGRSEAAGSSSENAPDPLSLGSGVWLNSEALTLSGLRGKVVLVDFWTYSCINCLRTLPYLRSWHEKYAPEGLVIVGVHSPEFAFERSEANLRKATADLKVQWPVAMDNDFGIWKAYENRYWPSHYLYGRDGTLEDTHFGEGAYEETEALIRKLLGVPAAPDAAVGNMQTPSPQAGVAPAAIDAQSLAAIVSDRSPETYLGYSRGERFASPEDPEPDVKKKYTLPASILEGDRWALVGEWTIGTESSIAEKGSAILFRIKAAKVYLVINPLPQEPGTSPGPATEPRSATARVSIDGVPVDSGEVRNGVLTIDGDRLFTVFDTDKATEGTLRIDFEQRAEIYAFTFG